MWRHLKINNFQYFTSFEIKNTTHFSITLTDLVHVWKETIVKEDAINRFKACNPKAELSENRILEFIEELFNVNEGNADFDLQISNHGLILKIGKTLIIKMSYHFILLKQDEEAVYKDITLPLLLVINELKHAENELCLQLEAKDLHLKEFELEGYRITRKNVETSKFRREEFKRELKNGLEERMKTGLKNTSSILTEDVNAVYPVFEKVVQLQDTDMFKAGNLIEEENRAKTEGVVNGCKVSDGKRCEKGNEETLVCKRIKATKKIIL